MDRADKERVKSMRRRGMGYAAIASALGLTKSQVSGFCRRAQIAKGDEAEVEGVCPECGSPIDERRGCKPCRFCSDECRQAWWNSHPEMVRRRAIYEFTCAGCGEAFTAYGNSNRRYCSHPCYIRHRYGKGQAS